jgi:hypothetical protein
MPRSFPDKVTMNWEDVSMEHLEVAGQHLGFDTVGEMAEWLREVDGENALKMPFDEVVVIIYLAGVQADPAFTIDDARKTGLGSFVAAMERGKPKPGKNPPATTPLAKRPAAARRSRTEAQAAT